MDDAREKGVMISNPDSFEAVSGHGLEARYADHAILIGNRRLMDDNNIALPKTLDTMVSQFEVQGKTAIFTAIDNRLAGIIGLADTIKENTKQAIDFLKLMGMEVVMLTGDNERTAKAVARKLGIDRVIAQVFPEQKEQVISKLKNEDRGRGQRTIVAMVGDGINDAPALATADLGIAIGSAQMLQRRLEELYL